MKNVRTPLAVKFIESAFASLRACAHGIADGSVVMEDREKPRKDSHANPHCSFYCVYCA
jgi:hypothetical protein